MLHLLPLAAVGCTVAPAPSSGESERVGSMHETLENGNAVSLNDPISEIVAKVTLGNITQEYAVCTGTFLLEDWVLTANHCVTDPNSGALYPLSSLWVHNTTSRINNNTASVDQVYLYPGYRAGSETPDIALLHVKPASGEPMFMIHSEFFEVPLDHSPVTTYRLLDFFGYGLTNPYDQTPYNQLGLREGVFDVDSVRAWGYMAGGDGYAPMPMVGDSGGPAFVIDVANSNGFGRLLAGVDSYGVVPAGSADPSYVFQTSVSAVASWIESYISDNHITDGGYGNYMQAYGDVNGDHVLDFCRIVGNWGQQFLACQLGMFNESRGGMPTRFQKNPYAFRTPGGVVVDPGYSGTGYMRDVNGDGRADFCRTVGNPGATFVGCILAGAVGFSSAQYTIP